MKPLRSALLGPGLALAGILLAGPLAAQTYPARPVRMVVPFPAGAASDFLARVLGQKLTDEWRQQIVVDNRPGAGGLIGGTVVARASPDGYTIALIGQPHLTAALLSKQPPWDPLKDFSHVGLVASMPNVLTVGPGLPVKSLSDLIAQVKAKPGYYNFGSAGMGSSSHLAAEMFNSAAGLQSVHVPFKVIGDIFAEMYGGRIHYYLFPLPAVMPVLKEGKIRAVATGGRARAVAIPQVPTMSEAGLSGFVSETYFGLLGPAGMPKQIIARINTETVKQLKTEDLKTRFQNGGADAASSTPEEFYKIQAAEQARVKKIIADIGLKPVF
ncbi:MAG TPA: tripartite tricarboxylate transporter substrate binding protein [Burkholderiales bacterium]|nr:tripartite tricarboxylate transporter substrate binding protein [Burkholderiales bacterium]